MKNIQEQVLDTQTTLIEYFVMDEHALAWVIDRDGFQVINLPITRAESSDKVKY